MSDDANSREPGRFVVPDPDGPPEGEPTTWIPAGPGREGPPTEQVPPARPSPWAPPGSGPYPASPPTAPPAYGQPGYGQPGYGQTGYGQQPPPYGGAASPPHEGTAQPRSGGSRAAKVLVAVVVFALVALGAFLGVRAVLGSGGLEATVEQCEIAADGTLTATGTVRSSDELDETLEVRFEDASPASERPGEVVDATTVPVSAAPGEEVSWRATGNAGDEVMRVNCTLVSPG